MVDTRKGTSLRCSLFFYLSFYLPPLPVPILFPLPDSICGWVGEGVEEGNRRWERAKRLVQLHQRQISGQTSLQQHCNCNTNYLFMRRPWLSLRVYDSKAGLGCSEPPSPPSSTEHLIEVLPPIRKKAEQAEGPCQTYPGFF